MALIWTQDPDLTTYRAKAGRGELIVRRLSLDLWRPEVKFKAHHAIGPNTETREAAQRWAEQEAGVKL